MRIQIVGTELPGRDCGPGGNFPRIGQHQRRCAAQEPRDDLLDLHPGDAPTALWALAYSVSGTDVRGPYIQGPPGGRFIYLNWGRRRRGGRFTMFRRAKLMLENVPNTHDSKRH